MNSLLRCRGPWTLCIKRTINSNGCFILRRSPMVETSHLPVSHRLPPIDFVHSHRRKYLWRIVSKNKFMPYFQHLYSLIGSKSPGYCLGGRFLIIEGNIEDRSINCSKIWLLSDSVTSFKRLHVVWFSCPVCQKLDSEQNEREEASASVDHSRSSTSALLDSPGLSYYLQNTCPPYRTFAYPCFWKADFESTSCSTRPDKNTMTTCAEKMSMQSSVLKNTNPLSHFRCLPRVLKTSLPYYGHKRPIRLLIKVSFSI